MANVMFENLDVFFFGLSSDVQAFKVQVTLNFELA